MAFNFSDGDTLRTKYLTESNLIDNYIGNRLWGWGQNTSGELGNNARTNTSSPIQTISGGINWVSGSGGRSFSAGIKSDGTLWVMGTGGGGVLGTGNVTNRSSPVQTIAGGTNWKQISCGFSISAAIKTDGTLWTWGNNTYGQLGTNNVTTFSSPVQTIAAGTNWQQVSVGYYVMAAIKTDSTLWLWGGTQSPTANQGILGNNGITNRSSPVQTVAAGTNWKQVSCSQTHVGAIKTDGTLWLWGFGANGALGTNQAISVSSPVQTVSGGTNWKLVTTGPATTYAIKTDGTLWTWGYNAFGALGDNTTTNRSSPVQTVAGGTNWKLNYGGRYWGSGIKTDGTLWLWGRNNYGQLGTNNTTNVSSPVQTVTGGNNWKLLAGGDYFSRALTFSDYQ